MSVDFSDLARHGGFVRALARQLSADEHDARDVEQEAWLAAWKTPPRSARSLRGWLATVVRNAARQLHRKESARKRRERDVLPPDPVTDTRRYDERTELLQRLVEELRSLREPYHRTLVMRYFEQRSRTEIAAIERVTEEAVKKRLARGLALLRERLDTRHAGRRDAWMPAMLSLATHRGGPWPLDATNEAPSASASASSTSSSAPSTAATSSSGSAAPGASAVLPYAAAITLSTVAVFLLFTRMIANDGPPAPTNDRNASIAVRRASPQGPPMADPFLEAGTPETESRRAAIEGIVVTQAGDPIAGARVVAYPADVRDPVDVDELPGVTTDSNGRFVIDPSQDADEYEVFAERRIGDGNPSARSPAFGPTVTRGVAPGSSVRMLLRRSSALYGTVTDLADVPLEDARVRWTGVVSCALVRRNGVSDGNGRYRVEGIPRTDSDASERLVSSIRVDAPGFPPFLPSHGLRPAPDDSGDRPRDFALPRAARIVGRVVDADTGAVLPAADIVFWYGRGRRTIEHPDGTDILENPVDEIALDRATADVDGGFSFESVPAKAREAVGWWRLSYEELGGVTAKLDGYVTTTRRLRVPESGSSVEVEIAMLPSARIEGRVVDSTGRPVEGARMFTACRDPEVEPTPRFLLDSPAPVTTDANGSYLLRTIPTRPTRPTRIEVEARLDTHRGPPIEITMDVVPGSTKQAPAIVLADETPIDVATIRVRDRDGLPIAGATVQRVALGDRRYRGPEITTDADGRASIRMTRTRLDELADRHEQAFLHAAGHAPSITPTYELGDDAATIDVTLEPGVTIAGRVVHEDGSPVAGAAVGAMAPLDRTTRLPCGETHTSEDGTFELHDVPRQAVDVEASQHLGMNRSASVVERGTLGPHTNLTLVLPDLGYDPRRASIEVTVRDASGGPVRDADFRIDRGLGSLFTGGHQVRDGVYRIETELGSWTVAVSAPGYRRSTVREVRLKTEDETIPVAVELDRGARLTGRAIGPSDRALVGANLWLRAQGPHQSVSTRTDAEGRFDVTGLAPGGIWTVTAYAKDDDGATQAFASPIGERLELSESAADVQRDLRFVESSGLVVRIHHALLPWGGGTMAHSTAEVDCARRSSVRVVDPDGRVAHVEDGLSGYQVETLLPWGDYDVRIEIADAEPVTIPCRVVPDDVTVLDVVVP